MKNLFVFKRMTAALLAVVILVSLLPVLSFADVETETEDFAEDFSTGDLSNWTEDVGTLDGGVYTLPGDSINYVKDVELSDVAVSADVIIYNSEKPNGFIGGTTAYVTARADQQAGTGYDFGIGVNGSGQTFVRLFLRNENGVSKVLYQDIAAIPGIGVIKTDTVYNIKIATAENLIICLINDVQVIQVEDTTFQSGSVGVRALEGEAQFDNVSVVKVPERKVESITIHTHSDKISKVGKVFFTATVEFNSVYGTLEIDQDTDGVVISGLDCTAGDKTVKVMYMGGEATFPVNVVNSIPDKVIYETNFNSDDGTWSSKDSPYGYDLKIGSGFATAYSPYMSVDTSVNDGFYRPSAEMAQVGNYVLETNVRLLADIATATPRKAYASLRFAGATGGGLVYEWRLTSSGALNVYYNGKQLFATNVKKVLGEAFEFGKTYNLKAEVFDEAAILYLNGKQAGIFVEFENGYAPYAGLSCGNGSVQFDSYKAVEMEIRGDYAISSIFAATAKDGITVGNKMLHTFSTDSYVIMVKYADGAIIPFPMKSNMVSYYDPTGQYDQVIRVTYHGRSCYLNFHYLPYLFYDDFNVFVNPQWNITTGNANTYSIVSDRFRTEYDGGQPDNSSMSLLCRDGEGWTDYSVSADVFFTQKGNANGKERFFNLQCRVNGSNRYELRLVLNSNGVFSMVLARFDNGKYTAINTVRAATLSGALEKGQALGAGNMYNLRLDCVGNTIKGYFQGKLMVTYQDETDNPHRTGTAGMNFINNNAIADNFIVKSKAASNVVRFELSNYPDGEINIWQGNSIPLWENNLIIVYADGEREEVALTQEMIGPFSNTELGKHSVDITYSGDTLPIEVNVLARPEYVADVKTQMEGFADTVDASNRAAFLELKALYDTLTPYEASGISAELMQKYEHLLRDYDYLVAPELVGQQMLSSELFNDDTNVQYWGDSVEDDQGRWIQMNGIFYQAQLPYSRSGNGWKCPTNYGSITGISADIMCLADRMHAGVAINVGKDGYYHCRISSTTLDEDNLPVWEFQFLRKGATGHVKMVTIVTEGYGFDIGADTWFNLMLTMENDIVNAYLNGELIYTYRETEQIFNLGEAGVRVSTGDALVDNVRVYGTEVVRDEKPVDIEPSYYTDDFEDEADGKDPSHWQEFRTFAQDTNVWKVFEMDERKVYGTTADHATATWLHAFDNDPSITVKFKFDNPEKDARFGLLTRMAPTTAYHLVGYDVMQQKWYAVSQKSVAEGPRINYQEGTFVLEVGRWYEAELVLEGQKQVLKIDGVEVFALDEVYHTAHGRMGVYTKGADLFIDEYSLKLASGDIPQDGIFSFEVVEGNFMEIEELPSGDLVGIDASHIWRSTDKGLTWFDDTSNSKLSGIAVTGGYPTFLKMSNGEYLQVAQSGKYHMTARVSKNMGEWTDLGYVLPKEKWTDTFGRSSAIFHIGSATEVVLADGTHRIFMPIAFRKYDKSGNVLGHHSEVYFSDDWGRTWNCSDTTTKDIHPGWTINNSTTWAESKVVSCSDGTLRLYYPRNYLGCMQYSESTDGGITWGGLQQIPEIQMPMTSFAVYQDPESPGTWYMVCCDQSTLSLGSMFPRDRFVLLRSTDGKNWEFLMNIERMFDYLSVQNAERLYQLLDPSLYIDEDYVHITFGRSEYEYSETYAASHQSQRVMYMRVEKDKLTSRPWDASTVADMYYPKSIEFEEMPQTVFGINDLFVCTGTLKLTDFLGNVTYENIRMGAKVYGEPDMFSVGTKKVELRYKNGCDLSYEIEVRPKAEILWTIEGEGTVDPKNRYIIEGTTQMVNLIPADGWKLAEVWVGDEIVETPNNQLELTYDKNGLDVWVVFEEVTIFDSPWFYIGVGGGVLIAAGAALFFILAAKKKKNATPKKSPEA